MSPHQAPLRSRAAFWLLALLLTGYWLTAMPALGRFGTDIRYYYMAAQRVARGETPYVPDGGYIYPPLLAQALAILPLPQAGVGLFWNALLAVSVLLTIWLGLRAAGLIGRDTQILAALAFGLLLSEPVRWGQMLANASLLVAGLLALAASSFWAMPLAAGVLLGLSASIKVVPGVFLAWMAGAYLRQRERRWLIGCLAGGITLAISLVHRDTLGYLHAAHAEAQLRVVLGTNFSLFSEIERASGWQIPGVLGPPLGAAAAFALGWRMPPGEAAARSGWGIVQLIALLSSPVAWSHLYVLAFWPALLAAGSVARDPARQADPQRWRLEALSMVIVFCVLARVRFFYLPDHFLGSVVAPLGPLIAVYLIGRRLLHDVRQESGFGLQAPGSRGDELRPAAAKL